MADYGGVLGGTAGQGQALQDILQQRFREALANQQAQQEQQKIAIDQQRVNNESDLKKLALQESAARNAASMRDAAVTAGTKLQMNTPLGADVIDSPNLPLYQASGTTLTPKAATLGSTNLSGGVTAGSTAPRIMGIAGRQVGAPNVSGDLTQTSNPGAKAKLIDEGLPSQIEQQREDDATSQFVKEHPQFGSGINAVPRAGRGAVIGDILKAEAPPKDSAEADKNRYRNIQAQLLAKQPVSQSDMNWAGAYEKEKNLGIDASAGYAAGRQADAIAQQNALAKDRQDFEINKEGRTQLQGIEKTARQAVTSADELRDTVAAAQGGNKVAAAQQALQTTLATIRSQGLNRINSTELGVTNAMGTLWDNIQGKMNKWTAGQPIDASLQQDILAYSALLKHAAVHQYLGAQQSTVKRYHMTDETPAFTEDAAPATPKKPGGFSVVEIK